MFKRISFRVPNIVRMCSSFTRRFTKEHEWISKTKDNTYQLGLSKFALEELGDVVYLDKTKEIGESVNKDDEILEIESIKAISTVNAPCNLKIERMNESISGEGIKLSDKDWIIEFSSNSMSIKDLLDEKEYQHFLENI